MINSTRDVDNCQYSLHVCYTRNLNVQFVLQFGKANVCTRHVAMCNSTYYNLDLQP